MLDALFTGGLLSDLERLDRINQIIENSGTLFNKIINEGIRP